SSATETTGMAGGLLAALMVKTVPHWRHRTVAPLSSGGMSNTDWQPGQRTDMAVGSIYLVEGTAGGKTRPDPERSTDSWLWFTRQVRVPFKVPCLAPRSSLLTLEFTQVGFVLTHLTRRLQRLGEHFQRMQRPTTVQIVNLMAAR